MSIDKASRSTSTSPTLPSPTSITPHNQSVAQEKNLVTVIDIANAIGKQQVMFEASSRLQEEFAAEPASLDDNEIEIENPRDSKDSAENKGTPAATLPELNLSLTLRHIIPGRNIPDKQIETSIKQLQRTIRNARWADRLNVNIQDYSIRAAAFLVVAALILSALPELNQIISSAMPSSSLIYMVSIIILTPLISSTLSNYCARAADQTAMEVYGRDMRMHETIEYERHALEPVVPSTQMNIRSLESRINNLQQIAEIKSLLERKFLHRPELAGKIEASAISNWILHKLFYEEWDLTGTSKKHTSPTNNHAANTNALPTKEVVINIHGSDPSSFVSHRTSNNTQQTFPANLLAVPSSNLRDNRSLSDSGMSTLFSRQPGAKPASPARPIAVPSSSLGDNRSLSDSDMPTLFSRRAGAKPASRSVISPTALPKARSEKANKNNNNRESETPHQKQKHN